MSTPASQNPHRPSLSAPAAHALVCPRCGAMASGRLGQRCPVDAVAMCLLSEVPIRPASAPAGSGISGDPLLGRVVGGRYPVVGLLGRGGMGAVYRAVQEPLGRIVALKLIRPEALVPHDDGDQTSPQRRRFFREAQAIAALSHPGIVGLYDYGEDPDGLIFMVMELIEGPTLRQALKAGGPLAVGRAVELTVQVLEALAHAHTVGVVHCDLKPGNIMVAQAGTPFERVKILDFGVAKVFAADAALADITQGGSATALGTPRYMAPEQIVNGPVSPRTDLYSVGILLYALLTGKPPFDGPSGYHIFRLHQEAEVPPLPAALGVPEAVERALRWALEKDPERRPPDALTLAATLRAACPAVIAPPTTPTAAAVGTAVITAPVPAVPPESSAAPASPTPVPAALPPVAVGPPKAAPPPPPLPEAPVPAPPRRAPAFALALTQPSARAPEPPQVPAAPMVPELDDAPDETSGHGESPVARRPADGSGRRTRGWVAAAAVALAGGAFVFLWHATDAPPRGPVGVVRAVDTAPDTAPASPRPPRTDAPAAPIPVAVTPSAPPVAPPVPAAVATEAALPVPPVPPTRGPVAAPRPPAPRTAAPKGPKVKVQRL